MATRTRTRRKPNTALVFNPAGRRLSIGGAKTNPRRRRKAVSRRRRNPVVARKAAPARRRNPRRINPVTSISGLVMTAVFTGAGVSLIDYVIQRVAPQSAGLLRTGIKAGFAWGIHTYGSKLPVLGKYKNEIALVLLTSAAIDVLRAYAFPLVSQAVQGVGLIAAPAAGDETTGNVYGNAYSPSYVPWG